MRRPISLAAVLMLALAGEAAAQSRYGPAPTPSAYGPETARPPSSALLSWPGKREIQAEKAAAPAAPARPEPMAPWAQRMASAAPPPERALPQPPAAAFAPPAAPAPMAAPAPAAPLPTSLYDPPPAQAPRPARPAYAPAPAAPLAAPVAPPAPPAPQPTALLGAPPPAPRPAPPNPYAVQGPRFYSVFREYGVTPDQIPVAPEVERGSEVTLSELPQTPTLASPDDTQYLPPRVNQSEAAVMRTR